MSWENQMTTMLRVLIDDVSSSQRYSDERLEGVLIVAAFQILQETRFETTYTVNISTHEITPDPTEIDPQDYNFINLILLKARCIVFSGEYKTQSLNAISVTNGPSSINMAGSATAMKDMYLNACKEYEEYKMNFIAGSAGKAILTPFSLGSDTVQGDYSRGRYFRSVY